MSGRYLQLDASLGSGLDVEFQADLDKMELGPGLWIQPSNLNLVGHAERAPLGVQFRAKLTGALDLPCGRCLDRYSIDLDRDFLLVFVPDAVQDVDDELTEVDQADERDLLFHAPENQADLEAVIREQIWLTLPLKPLCSANCKGLCATCGANKNRIECGCRGEGLDPRLAPLLRFKGQGGDSEGSPPGAPVG